MSSDSKHVGMIIAAAATSILTVTLVSALLVANRVVPNNGNLKAIGVEVFWDRACTNRVTSIEWGTVEPGSSKSYTVYIGNNGTAAEVLSMSTGNWNPASASSQMSLAWNCTGYVLPSISVVGARLTLTVSPSIGGITSFSFDITITGTESV